MLLLLLFLSLASALDPTSNNALYQCGVRRRIGVQLIERGWVAELGQWPWHAALFHVSSNGSSSYACGGTLLDQRHVLTSAHCVTTKRRKNIVPISGSKLVIHLGQYDLREITGVQQCKLVGQRGSVAGWGLTENQTVAQLLRTAQMPVVSHVECVQADPTLFGSIFGPRDVLRRRAERQLAFATVIAGGGFYISEG
ncbi:hypothetical protein quinque_012086 [Culex quinquefasciatus]